MQVLDTTINSLNARFWCLVLADFLKRILDRIDTCNTSTQELP